MNTINKKLIRTVLIFLLIIIAGSYILYVNTRLIKGDLNLDGKVNDTDFSIMMYNYGK